MVVAVGAVPVEAEITVGVVAVVIAPVAAERIESVSLAVPDLAFATVPAAA